MSVQNQNSPEDIQQQLYQIQIQLMKQEFVLAFLIQAIGSNPDLADSFEDACFAQLVSIAEKDPEAAAELEQYVGNLLKRAVDNR